VAFVEFPTLLIVIVDVVPFPFVTVKVALEAVTPFTYVVFITCP